MTSSPPPTDDNDRSAEETSESEFQRLAQSSDPGIVREFVDFLRYNKKWWMAPILIITLLLIGLAFLTASPAAPFIYTLF
ncbi:DUF5989 family protein [Stieleria varia]|uniref:Uncharacterized protein n=1 Tax=Stieleria varia TaxID=2528005 RepID=A0A5C6B2Q8_9BACT|nr:DUF5989 family protein [Stieleria varia]TWU06393.1 hypothetical protein Pla52n_21140 [Stieleria varia]